MKSNIQHFTRIRGELIPLGQSGKWEDALGKLYDYLKQAKEGTLDISYPLMCQIAGDFYYYAAHSLIECKEKAEAIQEALKFYNEALTIELPEEVRNSLNEYIEVCKKYLEGKNL